MAKQQKTKAELYREQRKARLQKAAKRREKPKMSKGIKALIAVIIVAAIACGIGMSVFVSGRNRRISVVNVENAGQISAAEFSYYYNTVYSNYFNTAYQYDSSYGQGYGSMITGGYNYAVSPDEQAYSSELEGYENPTWADFFEYTTKNQIAQIKILLNMAKEAGLELDDEDKATIKENLASLDESAGNAAISTSRYLKTYYGPGVNKGLVKKILEEQTLVQKYTQSKEDEFADAITEKELEAEYKKDTASYDVADVAYYLVNAEKETKTDDSGNESQVTTDATMAAAKKTAETIAEAGSNSAFIKAVKKAGGTAEERNSISNSDLSSVDSDIADWVFGGKAKTGDVKVIESEDTGYYAVYLVQAPYRDDTNTINVRHILINMTAEDDAEEAEEAEEIELDDAEEAESGEEEAAQEAEEVVEEAEEAEEAPAADFEDLKTEDYKDVVIDMQVNKDTATDKAAYEKALNIFKEYLDGDRTEDAFAELATKYTEDPGSKETGGLYEDVTVGQMVPTFNDWCFDESRQPGDVGIVETSYGYHIMYFVSTGEPSWKATIKESISHEEVDKFVEENTKAEDYPITVLNQDAIDTVVANTMKIAKVQIQRLSSQNASY